MLIIGSDFISDEPGGTASATPPAKSEGVSAKGLQVAMLTATPTDKYLQALRLTPSTLYHRTQQDWGKYFADLGATSPSTRLVDAVETNQ